MTNYKQIYVNFLKEKINTARPLTVVFDASNGPAGMIIKDLFTGTSVNVIVINDTIDPDFGAHGPNPLLPNASNECKLEILKHNADLGVMFDADADRAFFLDNTGEMIPACFIVGLLKDLFKPPYVVDELVFQSLRMLGIVKEGELLPTRIGAYFIKEKLREHNVFFGAEFSGHYYFKDFFNADSGIFTAIVVINALSRMDKSLSEWLKQFGEFVSSTTEIKLTGDKDIEVILNELESKFVAKSKFIDRRDGLTFVFDDFWINVRASNTEPIMRIIASGSKKMEDVRLAIEDYLS